MASSGSVTMPFNSCIRGAFSVLGIRTPAILMLLTFNTLAGFSSMKLSMMSPFSSTVFPSENMTRILRIGDKFVNTKQRKTRLTTCKQPNFHLLTPLYKGKNCFGTKAPVLVLEDGSYILLIKPLYHDHLYNNNGQQNALINYWQTVYTETHLVRVKSHATCSVPRVAGLCFWFVFCFNADN